jgi:hypothetical protein
MKIVETQDVTTIRPLYDAWLAIANGEEFGIDIDPAVAEVNMQTLCEAGGTLLVAYDEDAPVGFFALSPMPSAIGNQTMAVETMWFVLPNSHLIGPALFDAARERARDKGHSHLMVTASRLASDLHDKVGRFCMQAGSKHFETVYLLEI